MHLTKPYIFRKPEITQKMNTELRIELNQHNEADCRGVECPRYI